MSVILYLTGLIVLPFLLAFIIFGILDLLERKNRAELAREVHRIRRGN